MRPFLPFIIPAVVVGLGFLLFKLSNGYDVWEPTGIACFVFGGIGILVVIIGLPLHRYETRSWILQYEATKQTIAQVRTNNDQAEKAALIHKLIEINQSLTSAQYWSKGAFEFFWPKEIRDLHPLK